MRFGHFHETRENPERRLFDANSRVLEDELTPDQVNAISDAAMRAIELAPPVFDIPEELLKEGIHVGNN